MRFEDKGHVRIDRPDGHTATLSRTGRPDRPLPLKRRDLGDLIAEELRRLDADQPYAEALQAATKTKGLNDRPAKRTHVWKDPEPGAKKTAPKAASPKSAATKKATTSTKAAPKKSATKKSTTKKTATKKTATRKKKAKASR